DWTKRSQKVSHPAPSLAIFGVGGGSARAARLVPSILLCPSSSPSAPPSRLRAVMMKAPLSLLAALGLVTTGCYGLDAGSSYPDYPYEEVDPHLLSPELESTPSISLHPV